MESGASFPFWCVYIAGLDNGAVSRHAGVHERRHVSKVKCRRLRPKGCQGEVLKADEASAQAGARLGDYGRCIPL